MKVTASSWSLRGRLAWISAVALALALVFGGVAMLWSTAIAENQMLDSRLEHLGAVILSFVEEELEEELREVNLGIHPLPLGMKTRPSATLLYRFQVWTRHGTLLLRSFEADGAVPLMPLKQLGFATATIDGELHRTFALPTGNGELIVQVAENNAERWGQTMLISLYYMGLLLIPFGLVLAGMWWMFRHSLRSVDALAAQLSDRTTHDLTPVQVENPPRELLPILKSVDGFLQRMGNALSIERRFTSVAAHEMRTPLAGLRAHAQLARTARSPQDLHEALGAVMLGVDRASYLLEQLLDLAHIESLDHLREHEVETVALETIYRSVMVDLNTVAASRQLVFDADFQAPTVVGAGFALHLLLANLLGNAARHTPPGGRIEIRSRVAEGGILLTVDDSGPGIPHNERQRAFDRFERLGRSDQSGVGLGLSIVHSVVKTHWGSIELLDSPLGGLRVKVQFPSAKPA